MSNRAVYYGLWGAMLLAMAASIQHLAYTFGTLERHTWLGWVGALAVDITIAALAYGIQQRRRARRSVASLWAGVVFFAVISMGANLYHALSVMNGGATDAAAFVSFDWLQITKAVLLSASLPVMVLYLGEILSSDDNVLAARLEADQAKAERKAERELRLRELEAERIRTPEPALITQEVTEGEHKCDVCPRTFKTKNALAGHMNSHRNGKAEGLVIEKQAHS